MNNNNLSVLPFYTNINEQNHRRSYAYGDIYPLYSPKTQIPPFQIIRTTGSSNGTARLYKRDGTNTGVTWTVTNYSYSNYGVLVSPTHTISGVDIGQYYVTVTAGNTTWYSDIITLVDDISGYLKIEWSCIKDLVFEGGRVVYQGVSFTNVLYLCTQLGKPDYKFEEEGEDRDGYFFPEKQISEKVYKFQFLATEYLCDCMRVIRMSDTVTIYDQFGNTYTVDQFLMTPNWETQGNLANVEVEFHTDTVIKKIANNY